MPGCTSYNIDVGGVSVQVCRRRTSRITLRALPHRSLALSVPLSLSRQAVEGFIASHQDTIENLMATYEACHDPRLPELQRSFAWLTPGSELLLWGEPFSVAWETSDPQTIRTSEPFSAEKPTPPFPHTSQKQGIILEEAAHQLLFWGESAKEGEQAQALRHRLLKGLLTQQLKDAVARRLPAVESRLNVTIYGVSLRVMSSRWGSCRYERGRISLNLDLATHSPEALDLVLWHEACHLLVHTHGTQFKELMSSVYPQWKQVSDQLDYEGMRLTKLPQ